MATKKKSAKAAVSGGGFWAGLLALMTGPVAKQIATVILSLIAGAGTIGYVVSKKIDNVIPSLPSPRIPKLPHPFHPGDAIGQTRFGNAGCSATVIKPRSVDDVYVDILTAAHCQELHAKGKMRLKDGRVLDVQCVAIDKKGDVAWLRAQRPAEPLPFLEMVDAMPPPGSKVWHMGYGTDKPGNKEDGHVAGITPDNSKVQYRLSVSPGDSGGGIITTSDNKVISPVCCTTRLSGMGDVWGGTPARAAAIRPKMVAMTFDEPEVMHPKLELDDATFTQPAWQFQGTPLVECPECIPIKR